MYETPQKNLIQFDVRNWAGVELNCNMRGVIGSWGWSYLLFSMVGRATKQGGGGGGVQAEEE